jgi:hypothetical protein
MPGAEFANRAIGGAQAGALLRTRCGEPGRGHLLPVARQTLAGFPVDIGARRVDCQQVFEEASALGAVLGGLRVRQ